MPIEQNNIPNFSGGLGDALKASSNEAGPQFDLSSMLKNDGPTSQNAPRLLPLTDGEKAVGLSFNPSGMREVNAIKSIAARLADEIFAQRAITDNGEKKALYTIALRELQSASMRAVQAATWQY